MEAFRGRTKADLYLGIKDHRYYLTEQAGCVLGAGAAVRDYTTRVGRAKARRRGRPHQCTPEERHFLEWASLERTRCGVSPLPVPVLYCYTGNTARRLRCGTVLTRRAGAAAVYIAWLPRRRSTSGQRTSAIEASAMIYLLLWLVVGAVIGWLAAGVVSPRAGTLLSIVVGVNGIVGALIGGFLLGSRTINQTALYLTALLVGFAGAVVLLALVKLVRWDVR